MTPPQYILDHLAKDPILQNLIEKCHLRDRPTYPTVYEALLRSINFQQLSGAAATTIHKRFLEMFPGNYPDPHIIVKMEVDQLRKAGLSRQKAGYVQNTARFFLENNLLKFNWDQIPDEEIITQLIQIKGVGRWTVEMILMFTLKRPDILPLDDLVIRNNMIELYHVKDLKDKALKQQLLEIAQPWKPYRTTASRYLWQWKDTLV